MKKDIEWLKERVSSRKKSAELNVMAHREGLSEDFESRAIAYESVLKLINQLDEPEVLSQEEVDRAYKDGYEKGKQHTFYKGYLEGLGDKGSEPETVADVITDFFKSLERLKEVMSMGVEELEE